MSTSNDTNAIVTRYDEQQENGLWRYHSQKDYGSVIRSVLNVLETITNEDGDSMRDIMEWINPNTYEVEDKPYPKGESFAVMRHGSCEGYHINVYVEDRASGNIVNAITIKYLSDKHDVEKAAIILTEAFYNGEFLCESPPNASSKPEANSSLAMPIAPSP